MPKYTANCTHKTTGAKFRLTIDAANVIELREAVAQHSGLLVDYRETKSRAFARTPGIKQADVAKIFNLLAIQMDNAIVSKDAIGNLMNEYPSRKVRTVLAGIHRDLESSSCSLAEALAKYPKIFPPYMTSIIEVGDSQGAENLGQRFRDIRDQILFRLEIRKSTMRATAYPFFMMFAASGVLTFFMLRVIPMMKALLEALNVPLPFITRAMLGASDFFVAAWPFCLAGVILLAVAFFFARRIPTTAYFIDAFYLRLPMIGTILKWLAVASVAKIYNAQYRGESPPSEIMRACASTTRNHALRRKLAIAAEYIENSKQLTDNPDNPVISEAFASTGYFPEMALTILRTGERTGGIGLSRALTSVSDEYSILASDRVKTLIKIFSGALACFIFCFVGFLALSIWIPITSATNALTQ